MRYHLAQGRPSGFPAQRPISSSRVKLMLTWLRARKETTELSHSSGKKGTRPVDLSPELVDSRKDSPALCLHDTTGGGVAKNSERFYLGVWSSDTAISDREAADLYVTMSDGRYPPNEFNAEVYSFYCRLIQCYPEIDLVPENELEACPWACALDVSDSHLIMAIQPNKSYSVVPVVLELAEQHGLICFNPQSGKVHLPSRLTSQVHSA